MESNLQDGPSRIPVRAQPWSLQPVSRTVRQRPLEFVRRKTWTADPVCFGNGISAVTSLCVLDEASAAGPPLLIDGDEDGGVSMRRLPTGTGITPVPTLHVVAPKLRRARLHSSGINAIKALPDQRGFVCAGHDGILSAVATLDAASDADLRRATLTLTGHRGPVTDCDTASSGHAILSCSMDGSLLLWDPVQSNRPLTRVAVGRPVNSACFSTGDPYALLCAPEVVGGTGRVGARGRKSQPGENDAGRDDLVQIWDIRCLRSYREAIPTAVARAYGEGTDMAPSQQPMLNDMKPPAPPLSPVSHSSVPFVSADAASPGARSNRSAERSSWSPRSVQESGPLASPAAPLLWTYTSAEESSDGEPVLSNGRRSRRRRGGSRHGPPSDLPRQDNGTPDGFEGRVTSPGSSRRRPRGAVTVSAEGTFGRASWSRGSVKLRSLAGSEGPATTLGLPPTSGNAEGDCLHQGNGAIWVRGCRPKQQSPPQQQQQQRSTQRARTATARRRSVACYGAKPRAFASSSSRASCGACATARDTSAYSVQVSSDGRGVLIASKDATVTLWDAQTSQVVFRFGHEALSARARPVLWDPGFGSADLGLGPESKPLGNVITGMKNGELRAWRLRSQFPSRALRPTRLHEGYEITCVASGRDGAILASADASGKVFVQSAI